jgi:predicted transcriptional regulator YdeE
LKEQSRYNTNIEQQKETELEKSNAQSSSKKPVKQCWKKLTEQHKEKQRKGQQQPRNQLNISYNQADSISIHITSTVPLQPCQ